MQLLYMRYFKAVCQYGSFSQAAEAIHVSQPTLSIAIKKLEEEFGILLFSRDNNRLRLTSEGEFFLERASSILTEIDVLEEEMHSFKRPKASLRLSILPVTGSYIAPSIVDSFHKCFPEVQVELQEASTKQSMINLENDESDAALIIINDDLDEDFLKEYSGCVVKKSEFFFCVGKTHAKSRCASISIQDLSNEPLCLLQNDAFITRRIKTMLIQSGATPNVTLYALHIPLIRELLKNGKVGTFLTDDMIETMFEAEDIQRIKMEEPIIATYALIWKKNRRSRSSVSKFSGFVMEHYPAFQ